MASLSVQVQGAIYGTLMGDEALNILFDGAPRVYDRVPQNAEGLLTARFPYITIGEDQQIDETDQFHDSWSIACKVDVWSRAVGSIEAKNIVDAVKKALNIKLDVDGFAVIGHEVELGPRTGPEPDGLTTHSTITLRYRLGPTA